ncbi:MAG TPA: Rrf2 family transcriptional regulator [Phycisphaerae bacterium]|nr:Rrf2 family transcriptional regulator [Phycisphaerales bacterium]HRX85277.1 Rrf2 family transcriptional regulator [Phycisphaerae bacterium]
MLSLTRKSDYALVALSHLARCGDRLSSAREIADNYRIPLPILMNILKTLSRQGVITSVRGARGGYRLGMEPEDITLHLVVEAMEGPVNLFACAHEGAHGAARGCEKTHWCPIASSARSVSNRLETFLKAVTLAEIAAEVDPRGSAVAINC